MKKTSTLRVKKITNRLLESPDKLDGYSRQGLTAIRSDALSQAGMYIRPGTLSPKTGRIGAHAVYCQLKNGRKHRIAKTADLDKSVASLEVTCKRWREQGFADVVSPTVIADEASPATSVGDVPTFDACFEKWVAADAHGAAFEKSEAYVAESWRKWRTFTPDKWKNRPVDSIRSPDIVKHVDLIRLKKWTSQTSGQKVGGRWAAYEWLVMMSIMFNKTRTSHEIAYNPFDAVLGETPKPKAEGYRVLTEQEIAAVINVSREQVGDPHQWLRMLALKFALFSGFRRGGLVALKVSEINGVAIERDVADKDRYRKGHKLSIPTQLREILDEVLALKKGTDPEIADNPAWRSKIVPALNLFPKTTGSSFIHTPNDLCKWPLAFLRKEYKLKPVKGEGQTRANHFTLHDLRYTLETLARDLELDPDPILNHAKPKTIGDTYFRPTPAMKEKAFQRIAEDHQLLADALSEIARGNNENAS